MASCRLRSAVLVLGSLSAFGQATTATQTFDVASIKRAPANQEWGYRFAPGGRAILTNLSLKDLIQIAWHIQAFRIAGGASWIDSERYDIEAKAEGNPGEAESRVMLQSLLADRFRLALHRQTRELPGYALLQVKSGVRPGLVRAAEGSCTPLEDSSGPRSPEDRKRPVCGFRQWLQPPGQGIPLMHLQGLNVTINMLARVLGTTLDTPVADETGIAGNFDIRLEYPPDDSVLARLRPDARPLDAAGSSLFTALQEQSGLKLESRKSPVGIFVIDRAERPSEN